MLCIRRVPTMLSIHQDDEVLSPTSILRAFSSKGAQLPLLRFAVRDNIAKRLRSFGDLQSVPDVDNASSPSSSEDSSGAERSLLDTVLLAKWEDRFGRGLFRYDVTACPTRVLDGVYGFVAQLNEGRATKKRATEFAVDAVCAAFDPAKFNFSKADEAEVLFQFEPALPRGAPGAAAALPGYTERGPVEASPNLVLINVSPIEYGHVLLVPHVLSALPQQLKPELLLLALHLAREANNPYFRVGYNSMGAYATINHLHFQAYYLTAPFPIERAPTGPLPGGAKRRRWRGVAAHRVTRFPVRALVFEVGASLEEMAEAVGAAAEALQAANVPFNLLIADRGARVFLIPQRFAARVARGEVPDDILATGINPAVFEIAGHLLYKRAEDYDVASQESAWRLLAEASLSEEEFVAAVDLCLPA